MEGGSALRANADASREHFQVLITEASSEFERVSAENYALVIENERLRRRLAAKESLGVTPPPVQLGGRKSVDWVKPGELVVGNAKVFKLSEGGFLARHVEGAGGVEEVEPPPCSPTPLQLPNIPAADERPHYMDAQMDSTTMENTPASCQRTSGDESSHRSNRTGGFEYPQERGILEPLRSVDVEALAIPAYRSQQDELQRQFADAAGAKGAISVADIIFIRDRQAGRGKSSPVPVPTKFLEVTVGEVYARYQEAIEAFNRFLKVADSEGRPSSEIMEDAYVALMDHHLDHVAKAMGEGRPEGGDQSAAAAPLSERNAEALREIRQILQGEAAMQKFAKATRVHTKDLYATQSSQDLGPKTTWAKKAMGFIEGIVGFVIVANALVIGMSSDFHADWRGWFYIDSFFSGIFTVELLLKLYVKGPYQFVFGPDWHWNYFDTVVVGFAVMDFVLEVVKVSANLKTLTIMRLARLGRLTRLVRILRLKVFKELTLLMDGCIAGMRTLFWAIVFLLTFIYCIAVALRQVVGQDSPESVVCEDMLVPRDESSCKAGAYHLEQYRMQLFGTVMKAMFTVFRCFTDGCDSIDGTPLVAHLWDVYGWIYIFGYALCCLFVIFGLFNLIAAIFVENTIQNAKQNDEKRAHWRQVEQVRVANKMKELVAAFLEEDESPQAKSSGQPATHVSSRMSMQFQSAMSRMRDSLSMHGVEPIENEQHFEPEHVQGTISRAQFEAMVQTEKVQRLLEDLEICTSGNMSHSMLFDVLDAEGHGYLEMSELAQGLLKLRGQVEKSDAVAGLLATRAVQRLLRKVQEDQMKVQRDMVFLRSSLQVFSGRISIGSLGDARRGSTEGGGGMGPSPPEVEFV